MESDSTLCAAKLVYVCIEMATRTDCRLGMQYLCRRCGGLADRAMMQLQRPGWFTAQTLCRIAAPLGPLLVLLLLLNLTKPHAPAAAVVHAGDRKGSLMCWDLDCGSSSWGAAAAHQGHITALAWSTAAAAASGASAQAAGDNSSCCLISGGQDGVVRVWAGRTGRCVAEQAVHVDKKGKGAVGNILTGGCGWLSVAEHWRRRHASHRKCQCVPASWLWTRKSSEGAVGNVVTGGYMYIWLCILCISMGSKPCSRTCCIFDAAACISNR
jgi:hypothetical protein